MVARTRLRTWRVEAGYQPLARSNVIYLVYTGTPSAEHALVTALLLARQKGKQLSVLVPQGTEIQATSLATRVAEDLGKLQPQATVQEVTYPRVIEAIGKRTMGEAVILPADMPEVQDPIWFQGLLEKVRCPLVLVR